MAKKPTSKKTYKKTSKEYKEGYISHGNVSFHLESKF